MVVFLLSAARKTFKRQKTLTNLNQSLSKTKMFRLHIEDASTYWSQSFGKETTITWDRYDLVTAITMWSYDLCTRMGLIRFNYIFFNEILMDNLTEYKWFWELTYDYKSVPKITYKFSWWSVAADVYMYDRAQTSAR